MGTRGESNDRLIHCALNCMGYHSDTPSFSRATTMTTLARGGALHRTMLSEEVVDGSQRKMRETWCG